LIQNRKNAFSLIELIFAIVIIGIISSFAVPKLMNISSKAKISTVKQDINTIITSIQSYYLINSSMDKISDAVNINESVWELKDKEVTYKDNENNCVKITIVENTLNLLITESAGDICLELQNNGVKTVSYDLI
jgi:general secretion pathway protein G